MIYNVYYFKNGVRHESNATSFPQLLCELEKLINNGIELSSVHMKFRVNVAAA